MGLTTAITGTTFGVYQHFFSSTPEKTIEKFEGAYNNANIETMISCLDADSQETYAQLYTLTSLIGITPQELLDGILNLSFDLTGKELPSIDIKVNSISYTKENSAIANCSIYTGWDYINVKLSFIKENSKWHIVLDSPIKL